MSSSIISSRLWGAGLKRSLSQWPSPASLQGSSLPSGFVTPGAHRLGKGSHVCRSCGKRFAYSHNMLRHRRKCEGTFHLQCPICGQQFNRKDVYNAHVLNKHVESQE